MATQIKLRRDTAANWLAENPTLAEGEPGFDTTNGILKIGNGADAWTLLPSFNAGVTIFDQSLNTTNSVIFSTITSNDIRYTGAIRTQGTTPVVVAGGANTVVYSFNNWVTSAKLVIQVEGRLDGDITNVDHTQTCEATIAATYNTTAEPIMSVYGIVYTSVTPLATFTVRRTGGTIEVLAQNSQATNDLMVKVQALQFVSRYD